MHTYHQAASPPTAQRVQQKTSPTVQLRQAPTQFMQRTIGNQAVAQLMAGELQEHTDDQAQYERSAALPDQLRQRIEKMSGLSLEDITVFYGSNKPEQLGAHAFAQGNQIHLAPDQEQHLPHEAWHIVQQRQGRVQSTSQVGDTPVNEQAQLEQEATTMGSLAASNQQDENQYSSSQTGLTNSSLSTPITQLAKKTQNYSKNKNEVERAKHNDVITNIVDTVVSVVEQARQQSVQWSDLENRTDSGHLQQWYSVAQDYCEDQNNLPSYFWANFGYAVETLACEALNSYNFSGYDIVYQVAHGHTRPDIVISHNHEEIAWIDVTSDGSETHIYDKDGSGWETKLFVYEVLYDSLDPMEIMSSSNNPYFSEYGEYLSNQRGIFARQRELVKDKWGEKLSKYKKKHYSGNLRGGIKAREGLTTTFFTGLMSAELEGVRNRRQAIKGGLQELGGSYAEFGFKKAKVNTSYIRRSMDREAQSKSSRERRLLEMRTQGSLNSDLSKYAEHDLVKLYQERFEDASASQESIQLGFAVHHGILQQIELTNLRDSDQTDPEVVVAANSLLLQFPASLDVNALSSWITKAVRLLNS